MMWAPGSAVKVADAATVGSPVRGPTPTSSCAPSHYGLRPCLRPRVLVVVTGPRSLSEDSFLETKTATQ